MSIKLGIVGTNFISDWLLDAAGRVDGIEVSAVCSRSQETGQAFAEKHGIKHAHTDYQVFLKSDIDAVYIATPTFAHCPQALAAMNHKKHVLCEKIIAVNEAEVRTMIECAKANQVVLLEAMRPDFDPAYELVMQNLDKIGTLRKVTLDFSQYSSRYDKFREGEVLNAFNPELSNAAIMDIGVYCIHTLVKLFGMPKAVKAFSNILHNGFEGSGIVLMQYGGMVAEAVYSKISDAVSPSVFQGEDGSIVVRGVSHVSSMEIIYRNGRKEAIPYVAPENNMVCELDMFRRLIQDRQVVHPYLEYSMNTLKVTDEARRQNGIVFQAD